MKKARLALFVCLACLIVVAVGLLVGTETGWRLVMSRRYVAHVARQSQGWAADHWLLAPLAFVGAYAACSLLMVPVWWLQLLAGYVFGFWWGTALNAAGATAGAVVTIAVAHWMTGDWVHGGASDKSVRRLQRLSESLEHNGLLVVLVTRLLHVVPYGLSNYAFGVIGIHVRDAALGTLSGGLPVNAFYAALGSRPHYAQDWRFWAVVVGVNVVLLAPTAAKWYRDWRARGPGMPVIVQPTETGETPE